MKHEKRGPNECWPWIGLTAANRYGLITKDGKPQKSNRAAWEIAYGEIPKGMYVCHRCDNPHCVNPAHLFLGTHADNMHDKVEKGRSGKKLSMDAVREIRKAVGTLKEIGERYGVSYSMVGKIKSGKARKVW